MTPPIRGANFYMMSAPTSETGTTIIDGKRVAESIYAKILLETSLLSVVPKLSVLLVGEDIASQTYVRSKAKKCQDLGLRSETITLPETTTEAELSTRIHALNRDKDVHGILLQLPLPKHLVKSRFLREIDPLKDVDGLTPESMGRLASGEPRFVPCTPAGILEMVKHYGIPTEGAKVVVVGRSEIVGKPVAQLFLMNNATVTICHSRTRDLGRETAAADILVAAMGKPRAIGPAMVKAGAVVIDVGIHRVDGKLCGDVDFDAVAPKVSAITPVPGGVGPMTIAMLMKNLVQAASLQERPKSAQD